MSYKQYLRVSANVIVDRRKKCEHGHYDEAVFYKRCLICGAFQPFRNPEDIARKGLIGMEEQSIEEEVHQHI